MHNADQASNNGRVIQLNLSRAFKMNDSEIQSLPEDVHLVTFSDKTTRHALERGWNYTPELAPSKTLFFQMQEKKKQPDYNKAEVFNTFYKPRYLDNITNSELSVVALTDMLVTLRKGRDITLLCYCGDTSLCHTSIIKSVLEQALQD